MCSWTKPDYAKPDYQKTGECSTGTVGNGEVCTCGYCWKQVVNSCTNTFTERCTGRSGEIGVCRAESPGKGYYISGSCNQNETGSCYCWSFAAEQ